MEWVYRKYGMMKTMILDIGDAEKILASSWPFIDVILPTPQLISG